MLDRRRFTFGMLLGLGASAATAAIAAEQQRLSARYTIAQSGGKAIEVTLVLTNVSGEPLSIVSSRGSQPGPYVTAARVGAPEGEQLAPIIDVDRKELFSRIGPRPTFMTLAAGAEMTFGPYRYETPEGQAQRVVLTSQIQVGNGEFEPYEMLSLPAQTLDVSKKAGV